MGIKTEDMYKNLPPKEITEGIDWLGIRGRYLHVICGVLDDMVYIISAYFPDPDRWEADFVTRKG